MIFSIFEDTFPLIDSEKIGMEGRLLVVLSG